MLWLLLACACRTPPSPATGPVAEDSPPWAPGTVELLAGEGLSLLRHDLVGADGHHVAWQARFAPSASLDVVAVEGLARIAELVGPREGEWAALNGGFYDRDGVMGLVVDGGVERHPLRRGGGSGVIVGPSPIALIHRDAWVPGPTEALQSIDRLVVDGENVVTDRPGAPRAARSVLSYGGSDASLWLIVHADSVVARGEGVALVGTSGRGPTLWETAERVRAAGATHALNLDGAVSSQMLVQVGGRTWGVAGELGTVNAVVLSPPPPAPDP